MLPTDIMQHPRYLLDGMSLGAESGVRGKRHGIGRIPLGEWSMAVNMRNGVGRESVGGQYDNRLPISDTEVSFPFIEWFRPVYLRS